MTTNKTPYALTLVTIASLALAGWSLSRPAHAQNDFPVPANPGPGGPVGQPPIGRMGGGMVPFPSGSNGAIAAGNNSVYVLRGDTVYALRASDLSLIGQKRLPGPAMNGGPGFGNPGNNQGNGGLPVPGGGNVPPPPGGNEK